MNKVWLVTGASSGFGREITRAAVAAGDVVVGAARRPEALDDLVAAHPDQVEALRLDVTGTAAVEEAVRDVVARHGRIDVLVNNAGRTHVGAVEETTDQELRDLFDLHVFGPAALVRAVLPHMRERRSGAIVQMSSVGGQMSFAGFGAYSATKFALEGMSEALADEAREFGVKVLIVEPGAFRTSLFGGGAGFSADSGVYAGVSGTRGFVEGGDGTQPGDPARAAAVILAALEAERTPLRLPLGDDAVNAVLTHLDQVREDVTAWEKPARATGFAD
ncbi:NAD(P)-dependent dehydrogenase (short-subunit alcohol dehydrogenase family) [Streptomyces griseochromogenes]|uniref:NAD(P)-dependent dehydrogenase (Short-subunit alcohol dehydrogenase family) n=1 Tax=Streptomyces griseochromogenes TaxID=68214 RepID=A0A1B1B7N6_9ACTN|nr:SDR family NAD(P)-dependent oxidoreductase [Streptomyces griseochromogenes]ANP54835.1 short-chain dehydrogenase/reductase [Streptomyces griseochromogenes]MBP2048587.1 NAD(P)-dependent dehydrogenase (short-subunit alcohol dehydrogenase family) [Streptomyces griseochromogenes]